jgi:hypothetical protein
MTAAESLTGYEAAKNMVSSFGRKSWDVKERIIDYVGGRDVKDMADSCLKKNGPSGLSLHREEGSIGDLSTDFRIVSNRNGVYTVERLGDASRINVKISGDVPVAITFPDCINSSYQNVIDLTRPDGSVVTFKDLGQLPEGMVITIMRIEASAVDAMVQKPNLILGVNSDPTYRHKIVIYPPTLP